MAFIMEPVLTINFIFCMIILVIGYLGFRKLESPLLLYIGIAFGLFGVSHLAQLAGYPSGAVALIIIRIIAYLLVIFGIFSDNKKVIEPESQRFNKSDFRVAGFLQTPACKFCWGILKEIFRAHFTE